MCGKKIHLNVKQLGRAANSRMRDWVLVDGISTAVVTIQLSFVSIAIVKGFRVERTTEFTVTSMVEVLVVHMTNNYWAAQYNTTQWCSPKCVNTPTR